MHQYRVSVNRYQSGKEPASGCSWAHVILAFPPTWGDWRLAASVSPACPSPWSSAPSCDCGPSVRSEPEPARPRPRGPRPAGPSARRPGRRPPWTASAAATGWRCWRCWPSPPSCSSSQPAATAGQGPQPRRAEREPIPYPSAQRGETVA